MNESATSVPPVGDDDNDGTGAQRDWERRIGRRSGATTPAGAPVLPPPQRLSATAGRAQVTLTWDPVPGAVGYQLYIADEEAGQYTALDHFGRDVLAVPHSPYVDTTGAVGRARWYRVASLSDVMVRGPMSEPVLATPTAAPAAVTVSVAAAGDAGELPRPWRPMIGSEHLSHLLAEDTSGGQVIGTELTAALRAAHDELGVRAVRAHGILCDDLGVYREVDGAPVHDFSGIDRVYDHVRSLGLYPVVELSFMPSDLARDPDATVFDYRANVSPPKDWQRWQDLIRHLTRHLVDRYGREDLVENWSFEVWNEANLEVFWSGTPQEYMKMYDLTAAAIHSVDDRLIVGGPSSAAAGWVEDLLAHVDESGAPLGFVSTHTYGSPPLDFRPALERHGRAGTPIRWTEWGVTPTHFNEISDAVFAAVFLLRGMASAMGRIEALSYWVVSDHFEELGRPPALLHGGFGLRTVGELRKPRWWALALLERLGPTRLPVSLSGDGGGSLVEALATRDGDTVSVLLWNLTLDQTKASGSMELSRPVSLTIDGLQPDSAYAVTHHRVDADHSNIARVWAKLRRPGQDWPDEQQWSELRAADRLDVFEPEQQIETTADGSVALSFELPMPAMSMVVVVPC